MAAGIIDCQIVNQHQVTVVFKGGGQADLLEAVAKHLREDPSKPTLVALFITRESCVRAGEKGFFAVVKLSLPQRK